MYLEEMICIINDNLTVLKGKKKIAIWGVCENTVKLFWYTDINQYDVDCFIDNGKFGQPFFGKTVLRADEVNWDMIDAVVISAFYRENGILCELTDKWHYNGTIVRLNWEGQEKPFYQYYLKSERKVPDKYQKIIQDNAKFRDVHKGEDLFIIGNGPSIRDTDLLKIKNARKMVVSNFYLHEDYAKIKPDYYCFAQFTYTELFNDDVAGKWISEIGERSGDPQFFFNISEKELIDSCRQFDNKRVNYMYLESTELERFDEIDITEKMMMGMSVAVDCIQLAIYMGFSRIFLVGIEHSEMITRRYDYFYNKEQGLIAGKDSGVLPSGELMKSFRDNLHNMNRLWRMYEKLKMLADRNGVQIFNATKGGVLDVFDRIDYDILF